MRFSEKHFKTTNKNCYVRVVYKQTFHLLSMTVCVFTLYFRTTRMKKKYIHYSWKIQFKRGPLNDSLKLFNTISSKRLQSDPQLGLHDAEGLASLRQLYVRSRLFFQFVRTCTKEILAQNDTCLNWQCKYQWIDTFPLVILPWIPEYIPVKIRVEIHSIHYFRRFLHGILLGLLH